jgi:polyisoprenoid-binding protein YceI
MKRTLTALLAGLALSASPALAEPASYQIDTAHTLASFTVRHLVISNVRGEFGKTVGSAVIDLADPTQSKVEVTIDVTSIDTREPKRDAHLKSADFFDVAKYPTMTFRSTKVERAGEGKLTVTGDLTIKGTTKSVVLDVTGPTKEIKDPQGNLRCGISATTRINRKDFGVNWGPVIEAGPVVSDEVHIDIDAEFIRDAKK